MSDGNITAARKRLGDAIGDLTAPQPRTIHRDNGHLERHWIASRYRQLQDSVGGQQIEAKSGGQARLPIWADPVDLLTAIDSTVADWITAPNKTTVERLDAINGTTWRPQDTDMVERWCTQLFGWVRGIDQLLNPEPTKEVLAPCPQCGRRYVYRQHAGEQVRQAALQITGSAGCVCHACKASWGPQQYLFLIRLLGEELPEGVLE